MAAEDGTTSPPRSTDLELLVAGEHRDPHRFLGAHDGQVRALCPEGVALRVLSEEGTEIDMERIDEAGVWTAEVGGAPSGYRLEVHYPSGTVVVGHDPYRFEPTVGELDLHLLGEGRHRRLWQVLGAHPRVLDSVAGTSFAVWAPNARSVRVVGISTCGTDGCTPCAHSVRRASGSCSSLASAPGRTTSSRS